MNITSGMIEAGARALCAAYGFRPDFPVYYRATLSDGSKVRCDPIPEKMLGKPRPKNFVSPPGETIVQWPSMPYWQWAYAGKAAMVLNAAMATTQPSTVVDMESGASIFDQPADHPVALGPT